MSGTGNKGQEHAANREQYCKEQGIVVMNMLSTERTTVRKTGEQGIMVRNMLGTFEIFITPGMTKEHAAGKLHVSATGNGRTGWKHVIPRLLHF